MSHLLHEASISRDDFRSIAQRLADPNMTDRERAQALLKLFTKCEHSPTGEHVPENGEHKNNCTYCGQIID